MCYCGPGHRHPNFFAGGIVIDLMENRTVEFLFGKSWGNQARGGSGTSWRALARCNTGAVSGKRGILRAAIRRVVLALVLGAFASVPAHAQPAGAQRPSRIIVPFAPGAAVDVVARILANALSAQSGAPVIVENRPGGSGYIAAELVARSEPDGLTQLFTVDDTFTVVPHLSKNVSFDPNKELTPVNLVAKIPMVMVVAPAVPVDSLPSLIAYARSNPGKLSFSSSGSGSQIHLAISMIKAQAKIDIVHVPYKGVAPAVTAAAAGEVQVTISGYGTMRSLIDAGRLRAIAIVSPERIAALPGIATTGESGYPQADATSWLGLAVTSRTPAETVARINDSVSKVLGTPEMRKQLVDTRALVITNIGPAAFAEEISRKFRQAAEAVRISGAKED